MRLNFPTLVLAPVLAASAAFIPQAAQATVLHVPFAFTVAGQALPAGDYNIEAGSAGNYVILASKDYKWHKTYLMGPGELRPDAVGTALLFDPTGDGYELRSVRYGARSTSRLDGKSRHDDDRPVHVIRGE